jgi:hypothetical protein
LFASLTVSERGFLFYFFYSIEIFAGVRVTDAHQGEVVCVILVLIAFKLQKGLSSGHLPCS